MVKDGLSGRVRRRTEQKNHRGCRLERQAVNGARPRFTRP